MFSSIVVRTVKQFRNRLNDVYFFKKIMMCIMYALLNRPVYTRRIKLGKYKNIFSSILH